MDRQRLNFRLFAEAERHYEKSTREKLSHWQRRLFSRYSRNLALIGKDSGGRTVRSIRGSEFHCRRQLCLGTVGPGLFAQHQRDTSDLRR